MKEILLHIQNKINGVKFNHQFSTDSPFSRNSSILDLSELLMVGQKIV